MWHVSSRSGVATLRSATKLVTYLLTYVQTTDSAGVYVEFVDIYMRTV